MKSQLITALLIINAITTFGQNIINGSFENVTLNTCGINLSNSNFNGYMSNINAFGTEESIDILNNDYCKFGTVTVANDGQWFIGLDTYLNTTTSNAIAMELSEPLTTGMAYTISYYDASPFSFAIEQLIIGVSTSNSTFGDTIYTSQLPSSTSWTKRTFSFSSPNNGKYLTLKVKTGQTQRWIIVDNFTINPIITELKNNIYNKNIVFYPNPVQEHLNIQLGKESNFTISILNQIGQVMLKNNQVNCSNLSMDITELTSGLYFFKIEEKDGDTSIYKFVKE